MRIFGRPWIACTVCQPAGADTITEDTAAAISTFPGAGVRSVPSAFFSVSVSDVPVVAPVSLLPEAIGPSVTQVHLPESVATVGVSARGGPGRARGIGTRPGRSGHAFCCGADFAG